MNICVQIPLNVLLNCYLMGITVLPNVNVSIVFKILNNYLS